jgi:hypothetical protein
MVDKWTQLAQIEAMRSHPNILEDGPELPKESGPRADVAGEVLEGTYSSGCTSIEDSRTIWKGRRPGYSSDGTVRFFRIVPT